MKQTKIEPVKLGNLLDFSLFLYDRAFDLQSLQMASIFGGYRRKISVEDSKSIIIKADFERSLEDIIDTIYLFQDLLIFASGQITYPYEIQSSIVVIEKEFKIPDELSFAVMEGLIKPERVAKSDLGFEIQYFSEDLKAIEEEKETLVSIEIYLKSGELDNLDTNFDSQQVLFSFRDVKEQFQNLLHLWEHNSKKLASIIDLYLRLTYIPKRHINDFFLSLAQAIEAFHSLAHDGRYLEKKVYKAVVRKTLEEAVNSIPDYIPLKNTEVSFDESILFSQICKIYFLRLTLESEFYSFMKYASSVLGRSSLDLLDLKEYKRILKEEKLSHLNNYSLRERLDEIISEYRYCLPENFFTSLEDQNEFLKKIRKTRNYLTHLSSDEDEYVVSGQDLRILISKMKKLLEICLLKQLGFNDLDIKTIISKNR